MIPSALLKRDVEAWRHANQRDRAGRFSRFWRGLKMALNATLMDLHDAPTSPPLPLVGPDGRYAFRRAGIDHGTVFIETRPGEFWYLPHPPHQIYDASLMLRRINKAGRVDLANWKRMKSL